MTKSNISDSKLNTVPDFIAALDSAAPLADKRNKFLLPEKSIYMDGNSLGPSTKSAQRRVNETLNTQWQNDLIASWNKHNWIDLPNAVGAKIAPIIGAQPESVICCDSISVNLFKLINAALSLKPDRNVVVSEQKNFPTDLYVAEGVQSLLGKQRCTLKPVEKEDILNSLDDQVAVLLLTHVDFRTGEMLDMQAITQKAHANGTLVIWDLAHSAGAVPLELDHWQIDFAVGCGYKYLNGGPGSPAFVYVNHQHINKVAQPLSGWMGHRAPFEFQSGYQASESIDKFLCGTPAILSMAALDGALDVFEGVSMLDVRKKSTTLKHTFINALEIDHPQLNNLILVSPKEEKRQGSQLSFAHPAAYALSQALIKHEVIVDFRAPNIVRFGFTPLYLSHAEVYRAALVFKEILLSKTYQQPEFSKRSKVT